MKKEVVIVGAGPSGLAISACLKLLSIPHIILEREDCSASLWKKKAYDRLNIHLAKQFCHLPHMPHPPSTPTFITKNHFINYLDNYVSHFRLSPMCCRSVESATFDETTGTWLIVAKNTNSGEVEEYNARFLIVTTGENSKAFVPDVPGLDAFSGEVLHSSEYKSGKKYNGKSVLVVGSGNSGMEIALDLSNYGAKTSVVIRSPLHVLSREIVQLGMTMLKYLPLSMVDSMVSMVAKLKYGDMSKYGLCKPTKGPFYLKATTGRSPVIDVGTMNKIKSGEIQVLPALTQIKGDEAVFADGKLHQFDSIIFATGYRSTAKDWVKDEDYLLGKDGMPKEKYPNHWKGKNGLYCAGLSRRGLAGVAEDAQNIADDINRIFNDTKVKFPQL
ncbi:putative indole-3-pyruvate monooxygenase YUCCA10 [Tasmannia lanceolata]|uniref:putative indole-3-pyruvate monooxygenase YUCCA10 n=1 Tax=Tasmannia lanceolata TaxID=3420 RepID=UPI00406422EE